MSFQTPLMWRAHIAPVVSPMPTRAWTFSMCAGVNPTLPLDGGDDEVVTASAYLSGSAEAGGDDNRRWCDILHGRR
jgi:hypothetical protein